MKVLFKLNIDGTYTSIERVEVETNEQYKYMLSDFPDDYFKTFLSAKRKALRYMTNILNDWKYAVKAMREQTKENY